RQVDDVQDNFWTGGGAQRRDHVWRPRHDKFHAPTGSRCRHRLHSAGPKYLSGTERPPQSRAWWRRLVRSGQPADPHGSNHASLSDVAREGRRTSLDPLWWAAKDARSCSRPSARSETDSDRRALHRTFAADGAGSVRGSEIAPRQRRYDLAD